METIHLLQEAQTGRAILGVQAIQERSGWQISNRPSGTESRSRVETGHDTGLPYRPG